MMRPVRHDFDFCTFDEFTVGDDIEALAVNSSDAGRAQHGRRHALTADVIAACLRQRQNPRQQTYLVARTKFLPRLARENKEKPQ